MTTRILAQSTDQRLPGWFRLGTPAQGMTATEAFQTLGQYDVQAVPLVATIDGQEFVSRSRGLYRHPTPDSPNYIEFGTVGPGYDLITPYDLATALDFALGEAQPSSIGAPKGGKIFYVGYSMPGYDVGGDEISNTLLISSPYDGKGALKIQNVALRLICTNGLMAQVATETYSIRHGAKLLKRLTVWLEGLWPRSIKRSAMLNQAFQQMTARRIDENAASKFVTALLPIPNRPKPSPSTETDDTRMKDWHYRAARVDKDRAGILRLFGGEGQGMDTPAAAGTAWGIYNAVAEYYDHARDLRNRDTGVADALFGQAAEIKERAFEMALETRPTTSRARVAR